MEMPINKEIRNYTESVFFGLTMRQFIFSAAACLIAVLLYFSFRNRFGIETVSWICTLGAAPMACFGFIRYHGMNLEQFLWTWLRSEVLMPKYLTAGNTKSNKGQGAGTGSLLFNLWKFHKNEGE